MSTAFETLSDVDSKREYDRDLLVQKRSRDHTYRAMNSHLPTTTNVGESWSFRPGKRENEGPPIPTGVANTQRYNRSTRPRDGVGNVNTTRGDGGRRTKPRPSPRVTRTRYFQTPITHSSPTVTSSAFTFILMRLFIPLQLSSH